MLITCGHREMMQQQWGSHRGILYLSSAPNNGLTKSIILFSLLCVKVCRCARKARSERTLDRLHRYKGASCGGGGGGERASL